jgi:hypothetical protein
MSRQLLAKNLLRFGAKGLTESKMIKYLKEQVNAEAMMAWLEKQKAYAATLKNYNRLSQDRTKALLVKSKRLEPVAPKDINLTWNYWNNFVTLDGLKSPSKQEAINELNNIIEQLKESDEIVITSGASSSPASLGVNTADATNGAPSRIDHNYGGQGTDKAKFDKWNKSLLGKDGRPQKGNEYLAKMRGENIKAYMVQQGIDANKIKVIPKIETEKFMKVQGYVVSDREVITVSGVANPKLTIQIVGGWSLIQGKMSDYIVQVNNSQEVKNWKTDMQMGNATQADKPEVLKRAEAQSALGKTSDLVLNLQCNVTVELPGKTAASLTGKIRLGTGTRIAGSATYAKALETNDFKDTKNGFISKLQKFNTTLASGPDQVYSFFPIKQVAFKQPSIESIYKGKGHFTTIGAKSVNNLFSTMASPIMKQMIGDWIQQISDSTPVDDKGNIVYMKYSNPSADKTGVVAKNNAAIDAAVAARMNIKKTFDIKELASQGIKGSSPTMQYTAPYWTDALYYDATSEPPRMGELDEQTIEQFFSGVDEFAK